jgi:Tfp pilus assembly protein PilN
MPVWVKGVMNMKAILLVVVILLAVVGVVSIVLYVINHNVSVQVKQTSFLPSESIKVKGVTKFTPLTKGESDSLAMIEDQSLLGMTAGAFNPQFESFSSSEQKTLKDSEQQKPELQNMTAGDSNGSGIGFFGAVFILLCLLIVF